MPSPLSQGQSFSVTAFPLFNKRHVFQESRILLPQLNCDVQFRVSVDAFRTFVGAIGGTEPDIADDNARDLGLLSDGFRLTAFLTPGADWRAAHPSPEADTGRIAASPDEPLPSHDRAICLLEERVGRLRQAAIEGRRAKVTAAAKDIHLAAQQRRALAREIRALEGEIGRLPEAIAAIGAKLKEGFVCVQQEADDSQRQSQKREAMADVRNVLGPLEAVVGENGRHVFAAVETPRVKKQLAVEFCGLKLRVGVLEQDNRRLSVVKKLRPQGQKAPSTSSDFGELTAVVGLRGGSRMKGGLSARGLANVAVRNWSNDFTFIIGDHRYLCPSSVAQFLSPRVSELHWIDATISELRLEVDDPDELFGSVLEAAGCGSIKVDSAHQPTFLGICATLWNSEVYRSFSPAHGDEKAMENVADSLRFLSATRCDISPELEFIASHFDDFLRRRDGLKAFSFSMIYEILGQGSLRLESEDSLYRFISESMRTRPEMYGLIEFVRLEYCSTDVITNFFARLSEHFYEINVSMWASLRARLVLPNINKRQAKQFPPSVKKVMIRSIEGFGEITIDVPDGIVAHLTRECGGNVHDHHVVDVTSGSFERETHGLNPHSGAYGNHPSYAAMNAADLATDSYFQSAYRQKEEEIPHTRNNWVCYGFKERKIVATHYAIRTYWGEPRDWHLRSWLVKTSVNGKSWREVDRQEPNDQLNSPKFTGTFAVAGGGECRFIRLVNIGRNHGGYDGLVISAWDIFGSVIE